MENLTGQFQNLPGADLILSGIEDLRHGRITEPALLVLIAQPRLRLAGVRLNLPTPESLASKNLNHALYRLIGERCGRDAHSQYNALIRQLVSFLHAVERQRSP